MDINVEKERERFELWAKTIPYNWGDPGDPDRGGIHYDKETDSYIDEDGNPIDWLTCQCEGWLAAKRDAQAKINHLEAKTQNEFFKRHEAYRNFNELSAEYKKYVEKSKRDAERLKLENDNLKGFIKSLNSYQEILEREKKRREYLDKVADAARQISPRLGEVK